MYWQKRNNKYSFVYYDRNLKKNIRLKEAEIPSITSDEEADRFCKNKEAELESARLRLETKMAWQTRFYNFNELIKIFEDRRKATVPNSHKTEMYLLTNYVIPFFLNEKECNNLNNWHIFYEDFRDWLQQVKPIKTKKDQTRLAYSTMNGCIKTLNAFMDVMYLKRQVGELRKMRQFPSHLLNKKTFEDVMSPHDIAAVFSKLSSFDSSSADMFYVSIHSGLRLGELLGLSVADVFQGEPPAGDLNKSLKKYSFKTYGYIVLESQVDDKVAIRNSKGEVNRKPLKSRRTIEPSNSRTIPILDKKAFNILVARWKTQTAKLKTKQYGTNKKNYLLFEDINKNTYYNSFKEACRQAKTRDFSPHCSRHTYCTNLAGMTQGDIFLAQIILGHSAKHADVTMRYMHLFEQIQQEIKSQKQINEGLEFV